MYMNIEVQRASRGIYSTTHALEDSDALPEELCRCRCFNFVSGLFAGLVQFLVQHGRAQRSRQHVRLPGDGPLDSRLSTISFECTHQLPVDWEWRGHSAGEVGND